jgi:23S rRNA (adenine2030-N6)-methyltransferase
MHAYRHLFHAGNFADVLKHALVMRLAAALARKAKPFLYLETHAGLGEYDLAHPWARKNAEHANGIARIWRRDDLPEPLQPYVEAVRSANDGEALRRYPGSPRLVRSLLRASDRMVLAELNTDDSRTLAKTFAGDGQVRVVAADGYGVLKASLPPPERRALVLVDASFDAAGELDRLLAALVDAHRRFSTGVYALWYPLMSPAAMNGFERRLVATGIRRMLVAELETRRTAAVSLRGCGLLVVNPPFGFIEEAKSVVDWLAPALAIDPPGRARVEWLVPE